MSLHAILSSKFIVYALKCARYIHDIIHVKDLYDSNGRPTIRFIMAFNKKPKVHHLHSFGCPAVFKRFEFSKVGKRTVNKYTLQGVRCIFVGIPDDSYPLVVPLD